MKIKRIIYITTILLMLIVVFNSCNCYAAKLPNLPEQGTWDSPEEPEDSQTDTPLEGNTTIGLPTLDDSYRPSISLDAENSKFLDMISTLLSYFIVIGICVIVISTAIIGFDFMMGSANQKAVAKEKFVGLFVAAILLISGSVIAKIIINIAESM